MGCGQAEVSCRRLKSGGTVCLKGRACTHLGRVSLSIGWEQAQKGRVHRQGGLDNGNPKAKGRAKKGTFHGVYLGGWETGKEIKLESKSSQPVLSRPRERL